MLFAPFHQSKYRSKSPPSTVHILVNPQTDLIMNLYTVPLNTHIALSGNENPNGQRGRVVARYRSRLKPQIPATAGTPHLTQPLYPASACPVITGRCFGFRHLATARGSTFGV